MNLETFMLADAATGAGGKLYIHGGGFTRLTPPVLPWLQPQITIVLIISASAEELAGRHTLRIALLDPDGALTQEFAGAIEPPADVKLGVEGEAHNLHIVLSLSPVRLTREGPHRVVAEIDGDPIGELTLPVVLTPLGQQ